MPINTRNRLSPLEQFSRLDAPPSSPRKLRSRAEHRFRRWGSRSRGVTIQARVNLEVIENDGTVTPQGGTITRLHAPSDPGIRFDHYGYAGYATSLRYDSLLGKVITHGDDLVSAVGLLSEALRELRIEGVATNIPLLRRILGHPAFVAGDYDTRFIGENLNTLLQRSMINPRFSCRATRAARAPMTAAMWRAPTERATPFAPRSPASSSLSRSAWEPKSGWATRWRSSKR